MSWLTEFRNDVRRYTGYSKGSWVTQLVMQQGLWALFQYRLASGVYKSKLPRAIKKGLLQTLWPWQKAIEIVTGISLPHKAVIGPGLFIPHFGNIIVNDLATIGAGCNIQPGVTIGLSGRGENRGVPVIGDRVFFGMNAVVVGRITVGDDSVIGANSLVHSNVPAHCTVLGVPAVVINNKGSAEYLTP